MDSEQVSPYLDELPCFVKWSGTVFRRPLIPSNQWDEIDNDVRDDCPSSSVTADKINPSVSLKARQVKTFLTSLRKESQPGSDQEDIFIVSNMSKMMEEVVKKLGLKYKMFHESRLLKTGSVFEGVKLGVPDEFDFMIDLQSLGGNQLKIQTQPGSHLITYNLTDSNVFSDLFPESHKIMVQNCKYCPVVRAAWYRRLFDAIGDCIKETLTPGWQWEPINEMSKLTLDHGKVFTYNLRWTGKKYQDHPVSIDIVLCIPLGEQSESLLNNVMSNGDFTSPEVRVLMTTPGVIQSRVTSSLHELAILNDIQCDTAKSVLQMAKLLGMRSIGKYFSRGTHRFISRVPSYWIKTVWLYMLARYPEQDWVGLQNQRDRLLEMFQTMLQAMKNGWLSSFFIPGYNLVGGKDMSSLAHGISKDDHTSEVYRGLHDCVETILNPRKLPPDVTSCKELDDQRAGELFFAMRKQWSLWATDPMSDQDICIHRSRKALEGDAGSRDSVSLEFVLKTYVSTYFPRRFELRNEEGKWQLYERGHKIDLLASYDDIVTGDYFIDKPARTSQFPQRVQKSFYRFLSAGRRTLKRQS